MQLDEVRRSQTCELEKYGMEAAVKGQEVSSLRDQLKLSESNHQMQLRMAEEARIKVEEEARKREQALSEEMAALRAQMQELMER